jgi:2-phospho-L-lactate guanylyltransferase
MQGVVELRATSPPQSHVPQLLLQGWTIVETWSVVVPVKRLDRAKSRLYGALPTVEHVRLVLALVLDTVAAAMGSPAASRVVVVTDDATAARAVRACGAVVVPDEPDAGLNPALRHGARQARVFAPDDGVVVLSGDLPALASAELSAALSFAEENPRSYVADTSGTGTTLLAARVGVPLDPAYGPGSARAHAASGATALAGEWPSLRRDVDTAADLAAASRLGLGPHTSAVLAESRAALPHLAAAEDCRR